VGREKMRVSEPIQARKQEIKQENKFEQRQENAAKPDSKHMQQAILDQLKTFAHPPKPAASANHSNNYINFQSFYQTADQIINSHTPNSTKNRISNTYS
jgi:hypothetical protein